MSAHQTTAETTGAIVAKAAPPATVSIASLAGFHVGDILLWATLIYTVLMIVHKIWQMHREWRS